MHGLMGGSWKRGSLTTVTGVAQPTGKPAEERPQDLPSGNATAPASDPPSDVVGDLFSASGAGC
jgi:hypothetical protein